MKSLVMAVFLITTALGSYLGTIVLTLVQFISSIKGFPLPIILDNFNDSRYDYYFFILAILGGVNLFVYILIGRCFEYSKKTSINDDDSEYE